MAIDWSEIFQQGLRLLEPQFAEKTKVAESEKNTKLENLTKEGEAQTQKLTQIKEKAQKQAYISRMNAQRDLPSALAAQGIGGGASESVYAELLKNYENVRMEADNTFLTGVGELERELSNRKSDAENVYQQRLADIEEEKNKQAREYADNETSRLQRQEEFEREMALKKQQAATKGGKNSRSGKDDATSGKASRQTIISGKTYNKRVGVVPGYLPQATKEEKDSISGRYKW